MDLFINIEPAGGGVVTLLPPHQLQHILHTIQQIHTHTLNTITHLLTSHHKQHPPSAETFHTIYTPRAKLFVPLFSSWFGHDDDLLQALGLGHDVKKKEEGDRNYRDRNYDRSDKLDLMAHEVCGVNHTTQQQHKTP